MRGERVVQALVAALVWMGCGGEEPGYSEELADTSAAVRVPNGVRLNGSRLNGRNLNGRQLNPMLASVDYAGARPGGWLMWWAGARDAVFDAVWLEGTVFHGRQGERTWAGLDFAYAQFVGRLGDGTPVSLRVEAILPGLGADRDVWTYRVAWREPASGLWFPICQDADGRPLEAIPVAGRWDYRAGVPGQGGAKYEDPSAFTFACEGAAIAKCVRFGYKPWASVGAVSLAAHHQACTRLLRADYCGDGTSHTVDGQWVNLYDALGVQRDTEHWALEAQWDTEGTRCVMSRTRAHDTVSCAGRVLPSCDTQERFSSGVLLRSEVP